MALTATVSTMTGLAPDYRRCNLYTPDGLTLAEELSCSNSGFGRECCLEDTGAICLSSTDSAEPESKVQQALQILFGPIRNWPRVP